MRENEPTMPNPTLPTNARRCCNGGDVNIVAVAVFSFLVFALCALIIPFLIVLREKLVLQAQQEEDVAEEDK
jgi:hypothetical protein